MTVRDRPYCSGRRGRTRCRPRAWGRTWAGWPPSGAISVLVHASASGAQIVHKIGPREPLAGGRKPLAWAFIGGGHGTLLEARASPRGATRSEDASSNPTTETAGEHGCDDAAQAGSAPAAGDGNSARDRLQGWQPHTSTSRALRDQHHLSEDSASQARRPATPVPPPEQARSPGRRRAVPGWLVAREARPEVQRRRHDGVAAAQATGRTDA